MLCCAALVLVLGLLREGWFLLPGTTRPAEPGFAPVARRAAPRAGMSSQPNAAASPTPAESDVSSLSPCAAGIGAFALGTLTYAALVYVVLLLDLASASGRGFGPWFVRDGVLAALVLACAWSVTRIPTPRGTVPRRRIQIAGLIGLGAAWWWLGLVDMHVFDLFVVAGGSLGWDLVFHGPGAVLILAATYLHARAPRAASTLAAALPAVSDKEPTHVR